MMYLEHPVVLQEPRQHVFVCLLSNLNQVAMIFCVKPLLSKTVENWSRFLVSNTRLIYRVV